MTELEAARRAAERGAVLRTLAQDYSSEMTAVRSLGFALDAVGVPLSPESLDYHLAYLSDQGYVRIWRARDMPGYRSDRPSPLWVRPDSIVFGKLTPRGLQLLDGDIAEDPKVKF